MTLFLLSCLVQPDQLLWLLFNTNFSLQPLQVIETKTEMTSDHEDFAYNSLKVSEGLVLESIPLAAALPGT